jgi:hypothetical protein
VIFANQGSQDSLIGQLRSTELVALDIDSSVPMLSRIGERETLEVDELLVTKPDHRIHASTLAAAAGQLVCVIGEPGSFWFQSLVIRYFLGSQSLGGVPGLHSVLGSHGLHPRLGVGIRAMARAIASPPRMLDRGAVLTLPTPIHPDIMHGETSPFGPMAATPSPHRPHSSLT